jgi:hypothetical protein
VTSSLIENGGKETRLLRLFSLVSFLLENKRQNRPKDAKDVSVERQRKFHRNRIQHLCLREAVKDVNTVRALLYSKRTFQALPSATLLFSFFHNCLCPKYDAHGVVPVSLCRMMSKIFNELL